MRFVWLLGLLGLLLLCCVVSVSASKSYDFTSFDTPVLYNASVVSGGTLAVGTTYYYCVFAVGNPSTNLFHHWEGNSLVSNELSVTINSTHRTAQLNFSSISNAGSYRVYRRVSSDSYRLYLNVVIPVSEGDYVIFNDTNIGAFGNNVFQNISRGVITLSGGSWENPLSISDLYTESELNGWGVIDRIDVNTYVVYTSLWFNDVSYWVETDKTIIIYGTVYAQSTYARFGEYHYPSFSNYTRRGCTIIFKQQTILGLSFMELYMYSTTFRWMQDYHPTFDTYDSLGFLSVSMISGKVINCNLYKIRGFTPTQSGCYIKNVFMTDADVGFGVAHRDTIFEDIYVNRASRALQLNGDNIVTVKNFKVLNANMALIMGFNNVLNVINTPWDDSSLFFIPVSTTNSFVYDSITATVKVSWSNDSLGLGIDNCLVVITDNTGSFEYLNSTTDSAGFIDEFNLPYITLSSLVKTWITTRHSPYLVTISKDGVVLHSGYVDVSQGYHNDFYFTIVNTSGVGGFRGYVVEYNDLSSVVLPVWFFLSVIGFIIYDRRKK
jgi:hypothetical protein